MELENIMADTNIAVLAISIEDAAHRAGEALPTIISSAERKSDV
jgi:hypothetical protein